MKIKITAHKPGDEWTFDTIEEAMELFIEDSSYNVHIAIERDEIKTPAHSPKIFGFHHDISDTILCEFHYRHFTILIQADEAKTLIENSACLEAVITGLDHMEITMDYIESITESKR